MDNLLKPIIGISTSAIILTILIVAYTLKSPSAELEPISPRNEIILLDLTVKNKTKAISELESIERRILTTAKLDPESLLGKIFTFYLASDIPSSDPAYKIEFPFTLGRKKANLKAGFMELRGTISKLINLLNKKKRYSNTFILEPLIAAMKEKDVASITVLSDLCIVDNVRNFEADKWLTPVDLTVYPNREKIKLVKVSSDIAYPHDTFLTAWWNEALDGKSEDKPSFWETYLKIKKEEKNRLNLEREEKKSLEDEEVIDEEEKEMKDLDKMDEGSSEIDEFSRPEANPSENLPNNKL